MNKELEEAEAEYYAALVEWGSAVKKYLETLTCEAKK